MGSKRSFWTVSAAAILGLFADVLVNVLAVDVPAWLGSWPFAVACLAVVVTVLGVWLQYRRSRVSTALLRRVSAVSLGPGAMRVVGVTTSGTVVAASYRDDGTWTTWSNLRAVGETSDVTVIVPRHEVVEYYAVDVQGVLRMKRQDHDREFPWRDVMHRQTKGRLLRIAAMSMNMLEEHRELFGVTDTGQGAMPRSLV